MWPCCAEVQRSAATARLERAPLLTLPATWPRRLHRDKHIYMYHRVYWPDEVVLRNEYVPPPVEPVNS